MRELEIPAIAVQPSGASTLVSAKRIVGRTRDLAGLEALLAQDRDSEGLFVLVSGEAGVGKSTVLEELRRHLVARGRTVARGKFNQFKQGRPYAALFAAFESVIELALADDGLGYERHRERFSGADRTLLGVLAADFPQLQHVVGRLPLSSRLGPSETEHRFKAAFRHLLQCLCDPTRPLVMIIEDLQWADRATLEVLKEWNASGLPPGLTLVCSVRAGEAREEPHVRAFLEGAVRAEEVQLSPLDGVGIDELCSLVASELGTRAQLGPALYRLSRGNPLHAIEILKNLLRTVPDDETEEELLSRLNELVLEQISETVLGLITARIREFDDFTRRVVTGAACVGHEFSSPLLGTALAEQPSTVAAALRRAVSEGVLTRVKDGDDTYTFSHDRTRQAAYALVPGELRQIIHLRLGRHFFAQTRASRECLFEAIEHLNVVREALEPSERQELAELNLRAAFLAKESVAYHRAVALFRAFQLDSELATDESRFAAALALAECVFLTTSLEGAEAELGRALAVAGSAERELVVMQTWQDICQHQQRYEAASRIILKALAQLGCRLPEKPSVPRVLLGLSRLMLRTRDLVPAELGTRETNATPEQRAILELLLMLWGPSLWVNQNLNAVVVMRLMELTLRVGNAPGTAMAYMCFAVLNHMALRRHERALEFARLAVAELGREGNAIVATRVRFLALTFFGAFERSPQENVDAYRVALRECVARGEFLASHLLDGIVTTLPTHSFSLTSIASALEHYEREARHVNAESTCELVQVVRHWVRALSERQDVSLASVKVKHVSYNGVRDLLAMQLAYLWGDDELVLSLSRKIRKDVVVSANPLHSSLYCLLIVLAECRTRGGLSRRGRAAFKTLGRFTAIRASNFQPSHLLALAETTWARRDQDAALSAYRAAIESATAHGHELLHALAVERLACFHDACGRREQRDDALRAAAQSYARFGAHAKVQQLRARYPEIEWRVSQPDFDGQSIDLRLDAVMKAASVIAAETSGEKLGPTLIQVIGRAASAERALLLRRNDERWNVIAAWRSVGREPQAVPVNVERSEHLALSIVRYATRTNAIVNIDALEGRFGEDEYLVRARPRSVLCVPLSHRGELGTLLYLENSLNADAFSNDQVRMVELLGRQAAIALANAETNRLRVESVQSRVNPHFLYNALTVVAELIATSPEQAEAVVVRLSHLYRAMLRSSAHRMVTLGQELELVRDYLELERARFGDKLTVEWNVNTDLHPAQVPALLLQPLVENAVNHGVRRKVGNGRVSISAEKDGASLRIAIRDDGPGWYTSTGGNGFGLRSVKQRLELLYGARAELRIASNAGVSVEIQLPLG